MNNNGGWRDYPDNVKNKIFFRASGRYTASAVIKSGQVLKARSFLESDSSGKLIAHGGLAESAIISFPATIAAASTVIVAGLTFTAGAAAVTAAQLVAAFSGLAPGDTLPTVSYGAFSGTLVGFSFEKLDDNSVTASAVTAGSNVTDITVTGTATGITTAISQGTATFNKIAGVLCFDVDASAADVDASVYTEASFWSSALVWAVDPASDTITLSDGTTKAVTAYNTGCAGSSKEARLLQQKFVEGSEFMELGFLNPGEVA